MSQLYINNDADAIFICGDLNARCGNVIDTLLDDSDIPERHVMDTCTVNLYGEKVIDFVRDIRQGYILTNLINMSVKLFSTVSIVFFPVDFKSARYHSRFCIFN